MTIEELPISLIKVASFKPISLEAPDAWCGHIPFAFWLIGQLKPETFVELGTHSGNSYFAFCQAVKELELGTRCFAVDSWKGDEHAGEYSGEIYEAVDVHNRLHYSGFSQLMRMYFDEAAAHFPDRSIELLHIDGLHTYDAVKHDFETWLPKLAPGAVVLFHDTVVRERNFGVWRLWDELTSQHAHAICFGHSNGLGVLQLETEAQDKYLEWLEPTCEYRPLLMEYFSSLGQHQIDRLHNKLREVRSERPNDVIRELRERDAIISTLNAEISRLNLDAVSREQEAFKVRAQVEFERLQVAAILNSSSWRLTKPLRIAKRFAAKIWAFACGAHIGRSRS